MYIKRDVDEKMRLKVNKGFRNYTKNPAFAGFLHEYNNGIIILL